MIYVFWFILGVVFSIFLSCLVSELGDKKDE